MSRIQVGASPEEIMQFQLPSYNEIPNVGLFLEQVSKYIGEYTEPLECVSLTSSMISNYVKKKIIKNPVHKQYDREQIACLFFITIAKTVLPLEDVQMMLQLQEEACERSDAYEYFRTELKRMLLQVFGAEEAAPDAVEEKLSDSDRWLYTQKELLHKVILAAAHQVYLEKTFAALREEM